MSDDTQKKVNAKHLNTEEFKKIVESAGRKPVMIDFYAEWCGPCKLAAPVIDKLSGEYNGKAVIAKVDVDENRELAQEHGVMSIPTVIIFKNGEEFDRKIGFPGEVGYRQMIDGALDEDDEMPMAKAA